MPNLVNCASCSAAVPSGRFCAICGSALMLPPMGMDVLPARRAQEPSPVTVPAAPGAAHVPASGPTGPAFVPQPATIASSGGQPTWTEASEVAKARRQPRRGYAIAAVITVVAGVLVFGGDDQHTVTGDLTLYDSDLSHFGSGDFCSGSGGYDDMRAGQQVVIADEAGRTLATTSLDAGEYDGTGCMFSFSLEDVSEADFYKVTLGRSSRGEMQYSYDEMVEADWSVHLSLGER